MTAFPTNQTARNERSPRLLASALLTTTDDRIYVVPPDRLATVQTVVVCNTHTTTATFRLHHVAPGATSGAGNAQYFDSRLANSVTLIDEAARPMQPGDALRGKASIASVVAVSIYGTETPVRP